MGGMLDKVRVNDLASTWIGKVDILAETGLEQQVRYIRKAHWDKLTWRTTKHTHLNASAPANGDANIVLRRLQQISQRSLDTRWFSAAEIQWTVL